MWWCWLESLINMNKSVFILLALGLLKITGCNQNLKFNPKGNFSTPGSIIPLKGNVISLFEMNYVSYPVNHRDTFRLNDTDSICFDEAGNITYEMFRIVNIMDSERIYKFDENGMQSSSKLFENDSLTGQMNSISKRTGSNKFELIVYENAMPSKKSTYTYDKNSFLIEKKEYLIKDGKEVFKLHQKQENKSDGRIASADFYDISGKQIGHYAYIYGSHFAPDTIKTINHNTTSVHVYKFDQYGNPLLSMIDGVIKDRYEYEHDRFGNWTKRIIFENDKKSSYQLRKYYYRN